MHGLQAEERVGLEYLQAVTTLLQRCRNAHPVKGLYEAADFQWWWRVARPTDALGQLFWFDDQGRPEAAVIVTKWNDRVALDPIFLPDAAPELVALVMQRGIDHANQAGYTAFDLEVDPADEILHHVLVGHGFTTVKTAGLPTAYTRRGSPPTTGPTSAPCTTTTGCSVEPTRSTCRTTEPEGPAPTSNNACFRHRCTALI